LRRCVDNTLSETSRAVKVVERLVYTHFQTVFAFCIRPSEIANNIAPQRGKGAEAAIDHSISRYRKIPAARASTPHLWGNERQAHNEGRHDHGVAVAPVGVGDGVAVGDGVGDAFDWSKWVTVSNRKA
jgi:hypothetical protein